MNIRSWSLKRNDETHDPVLERQLFEKRPIRKLIHTFFRSPFLVNKKPQEPVTHTQKKRSSNLKTHTKRSSNLKQHNANPKEIKAHFLHTIQISITGFSHLCHQIQTTKLRRLHRVLNAQSATDLALVKEIALLVETNLWEPVDLFTMKVVSKKQTRVPMYPWDGYPRFGMGNPPSSNIHLIETQHCWPPFKVIIGMKAWGVRTHPL